VSGIKRAISFVPSVDLKAAAIVGCVLVLPFIALEWMNGPGFANGVPAPLFAVMWLLTALFVVIVMPVLRTPLERRGTADIVILLSRVVLGIVVAGLWISLVQDQMPCFLGVPNCD
jgi:cation transport ATPase